MKPITAPIVGGMITSTIYALALVPVFFTVERALKRFRFLIRRVPQPGEVARLAQPLGM